MDAFAPISVRPAVVLQGGCLQRPACLEQRTVGDRVFVKVLALETLYALASFFLTKNQTQALAQDKKNFRVERLVRSWDLWNVLRRSRNEATLAAVDEALAEASLDKPKLDLGLDVAPPAAAKRRRIQLPLGDRPATVTFNVSWGDEDLEVVALSGQRMEPLWLEFTQKTFEIFFKAFRRDLASKTGFGRRDPVADDEEEEEEEDEDEDEDDGTDDDGALASHCGHRCGKPFWYASRNMWILKFKTKDATRWSQKTFSVRETPSPAVFQERKEARLATANEFREEFMASASGVVNMKKKAAN